MAYKVFLDTNIILDIFHQDRPFYKDAIELFYSIDENKFVAYYSESVLTTAAYVLRKNMTSQINQAPLNLNRKIHFLPCFPSLIPQSLVNNPPDFEDALLYEIAMHHQMDYFITSNIKDFKSIQKNILPVMTAIDFNK